MGILILGGFVLFAVADWIAVANGWKSAEYVAKPAALAFLLLYAALQPDASWLLIAALMFSLLGDVYLMLPIDLFIAGLTAFLVGHVAYVFAFDVGLLARVLWLVIVAVAASPLAYRILTSVRPDSMRAPVAGYMAVISLMVASAIAAGSASAIAGALLFFASDAMIAWDRFVAPFPGARVAIIVTYHLGQLGLVYGLTG